MIWSNKKTAYNGKRKNKRYANVKQKLNFTWILKENKQLNTFLKHWVFFRKKLKYNSYFQNKKFWKQLRNFLWTYWAHRTNTSRSLISKRILNFGIFKSRTCWEAATGCIRWFSLSWKPPKWDWRCGKLDWPVKRISTASLSICE